MLIFPSFFNAQAGAYEIEQSLRFSGDSNQYLYRTGAITAQGGVSLWVKFHRDVGSYTAGVYDPIIYLSGGGPWLYRNPYGYLYYRSISSGGDSTWSAQRTRDHSAWYHIFLKFNSSNSTSLYVNNVLWGTKSANIGTANSNQRIGYDGTYRAQYYLAEYHAAFGESLDATDFGEYNDSGVWVPKEFTGNYGSQGFYLKFDPSATNGLGHDHSGNGNHFTDAGGFDTTSGTGTDVMSDTPTTNWATLNPLDKKASFSYALEDGNLVHHMNSGGSGNFTTSAGSISVSSGKWYWEITTEYLAALGILDASVSLETNGGIFWNNAAGYIYYGGNGNKFNNGTSTAYGSTFGSGDTIGIAFDADAGKIWFAKNNTWQASGDPAAGTNAAFTGIPAGFYRPAQGIYRDGSTRRATFNFGQRAFAYTPPTGFKALNTANLPAPTVKDGSEYFNTVLYTGNGSTDHAITGVGFQPDFVWGKRRDGAFSHGLFDSIRGGDKRLVSNLTNAEDTLSEYIKSFDTDGFTLGNDANLNYNTASMVAWNWLAGGSGSSNTAGSITSTVSANPSAGFSIVSYTGNGTAGATVGHGLGVAPSMIITKARGVTSEWGVYHSALGGTKALLLNQNYSQQTNSLYWNNTNPSSTLFTLGGGSTTNNTATYIAYCFAEVEGYSKFGSYTGTNTNDGPFVYCGFKPRWIMVKSSSTGGSSAYSWSIIDTARSSYNIERSLLKANEATAQNTAQTADVDILSNGFKPRYSPNETNGPNTYVFAAFAEHPFGGSGVSPATAR